MYSTHLWHLFHLCSRQIVWAWLLALPLVVQAQNKGTYGNLPKHDKKKIHFGMKLGITNSRFAITHSENFIYHDSIKVVELPVSPGFNVGIISDLHLGDNADLRFIPTLIFAEKDLRYTEIAPGENIQTTKTIESIILSFPLAVKYKSDRFFNDNFRFYVLGGARFDWDLASNSKARRATEIVKIAPSDFALEYGLGAEIYFPLFILSPEIRISHGMTNLFVPTENLRYSDVLGTLRSRYVTFSLQFEG